MCALDVPYPIEQEDDTSATVIHLHHFFSGDIQRRVPGNPDILIAYVCI